MQKLFSELRRRSIFRVAGLYAVVAWLTMQVVTVMTPALKLPDWVDSFFALTLIIGFPVAMVIAWAFELTPKGVKRTRPIDGAAAATAPVDRKLDYMILASLIVIIGLIGWQMTRSEKTVETRTELVSIAVLPFTDLSPDSDQEYFSDGLSEELLNLLAKIPDLRVAARTSAFSFKGKEAQVSDIADALNVGHVLEGSVRLSGQRVRITAQLIHGESGYHVWSETYDRTMYDIFSVQDEIAAQVVEKLQLSMPGEMPKTRAADPAAYTLFLQGNHLMQRYTDDAISQSIELFQEAIAIDPDYTPLWTELSSAYINQMSSGTLQSEKGCPLAKEAANTALKIDLNHAPGYAKLAALAYHCDKNLQAAANYYEQALKLDPVNSNILGDAAVLAEDLGRLDTSIAIKEFQVRQQPVAAIAHNNLALAYYFKGRYDDAEKAIRTALTISPEYIGAHYRLGSILLMKGNPQGALDEFSKEADDEYRTKGEAVAKFALGDQAGSDAALKALVEGWGDIWPEEVAQVYAYRGEADSAFEWLEKRYADGGPDGWYEGKKDPLVGPIKADPRWEPFLQKMNLSDAQLSAIEFNVVAPPH